jgi:hypothetical protein
MIESLIYSGLVPKPLSLKLNPVWWFKNDGEPDPPADYKPDKPQWLRVLFWYLRNPLVNFCDYVIGVEDRDHIAYGQAPIDITDWLDAGETGWKFGVLKVNLRLAALCFLHRYARVVALWVVRGGQVPDQV